MPHYREATIDDIAGISRLGHLLNDMHHQAWPQIFASAEEVQRDETNWRRSIGAANATTFVAEEGGELVGFVSVYLISETHTFFNPIRYAHVGSICVDASHRGEGIGRTLMTLAEQWAQEKGAVDMRLTVWAFNEGAQRLYEELGYGVRSVSMGKTLLSR
ncbi:GNAT family N-acetyltransferase [Pseudomonas asuensis]|uniref:Ribosomal-protein-alanine acetyltransferase n=1 Tax=Pseudomonas asuensis TaxID=1825787 RepID=A0ABQ2GQX0_9PSED|nr:GNAT family N-acetyltransferase [Pseudomonas asuensis]GGM08530.1 ribosomal-protein-alanine acetyltransferase [Pseudomonas asuensis]